MAFEKLSGPCAKCTIVDFCHADTTPDDINDWPEEMRNLALCKIRIDAGQKEKNVLIEAELAR